MSRTVQSAQTRDNIRKAKAVWDAKQQAKRDTREFNQRSREARSDKGQLARLDQIGERAVKERVKIAKRLEEANAK